MIEGGTADFIVIMSAMVLFAWLLNGLIKSWRTGGIQSGETLETVREVKLLTSENAGLKAQVMRLEERISVLERIATDPARRTAREIEELR